MAKVTKTSRTPFIKGGNTKMFGRQQVVAQAPGVTETTGRAVPGKFLGGGSKKMFGKQSAGAAKKA